MDSDCTGRIKQLDVAEESLAEATDIYAEVLGKNSVRTQKARESLSKVRKLRDRNDRAP